MATWADATATWADPYTSWTGQTLRAPTLIAMDPGGPIMGHHPHGLSPHHEPMGDGLTPMTTGRTMS